MREAKDINLIDFEERLVGLEFENPLVSVDGMFISQNDIHNFWTNFIEEGDEEDVDYLTQTLVGAKKKLANGQFESLNTDTSVSHLEMSLLPQPDLNTAKKYFEEVIDKVLEVSKKLNFRLLGYGAIPNIKDVRILDYKTKKSLYAALSLRRHNVAMSITAHQTGVSIRADEVVDVINTLQALSGAVTCLTANSPIFEERVTPWKEIRLTNWRLFATSFTSEEELRVFPEMRKEPFKSIADYFNYIWAGKMVLPVMREGQWVKTQEELSFKEYFSGKKWVARDLLGNETILVPSVGDINLAGICAWHDAKPHLTFANDKTSVEEFIQSLDNDNLEEYVNGKLVNCYVEYRIAATSPQGDELALPALTLGMINNLEDAKNLVNKYSWEDWRTLRNTSYITAMESKISEKSVIPVLEEMVSIAESGLKKRNFGEEKYLEPMKKRISERKCPADKCIEVFKKGGMESFLDFVSY